ncbi:MAG: hypothetical protein JWN03_5197 [Nocardia sp.]|uniref:nitroreductase family protein n=1 Tax=Nocardia sp. TaxID=1821 RepID=UPI002625638B|nr:nitroreductase [Nocardia sp.]MCU1644922.1 hypothetical protein [Nocardia sp.]
MNLVVALKSRRSQPRLCSPAPDDETLLELIRAAAHGPDHGRLRPWRFVVLRDAARERLGDMLAEGSAEPDKERQKVQRAPLLLGIVFSPEPDHKIPRWEQLAATVCVSYGVSLALHSEGWASIWRTGARLSDPRVRDFLELASAEELLGWLYIGMPMQAAPPARRVDPDLSGKVYFKDAVSI